MSVEICCVNDVKLTLLLKGHVYIPNSFGLGFLTQVGNKEESLIKYSCLPNNRRDMFIFYFLVTTYDLIQCHMFINSSTNAHPKRTYNC